MQLTISSDYAIRIVCFLANEDKMCSTAMIADKLGIPNSYIPKIAKKLKDSDIIKAVEGIQGGYKLSKVPSKISLWDILNVMESTLKINRCLECDHKCSRNATMFCTVHQVFGVFQREFEYYLQRTTIAELVGLTNETHKITTYFINLAVDLDTLKYQIIYSSDNSILSWNDNNQLLSDFGKKYLKEYVYQDDQGDMQELFAFKNLKEKFSNNRWGKEIYFRKKESNSELGYIWVLMQMGVDENNNKLLITIKDSKLIEHYMNKVEKNIDKQRYEEEKKYWDNIKFLARILNRNGLVDKQQIEDIIRYTRIVYQKLSDTYPELNITKEEIDNVSHLVPICDIGKVQAIYQIKSNLSMDEDEKMKEHTKYGAEIFEEMFNDAMTENLNYYSRNICLYHHERYDGSGYPERLVGDEIPRCAQIAGLVDSYVSLVNPPKNKKAYSKEMAIQMIIAGQCGAFSPQLIHCFIQATTDRGWEKGDENNEHKNN